MLSKFIKLLEKRIPLETLLTRFPELFRREHSGHQFTDEAFSSLLQFLHNGETSYRSVAVQAGLRWSASSQKPALRNTIQNKGFLTPSCLWAYKNLRGTLDVLFQEFDNPEMILMQIVLLKEADPALSVPFLMDKFLSKKEVPDEIKLASRLSILRILDSGISPKLLQTLQSKYPGVEILKQWNPGIPGRRVLGTSKTPVGIDFHQLVRSVRDMRDLSSLTRTLYLSSLFYIPLTEKEWQSLWLSSSDHQFFYQLKAAGIIETIDGGHVLSCDPAKQILAKRFLFESYPLIKESVQKNRKNRLKEEHEKRVKTSELDRQALEIVPDGIICIEKTGRLFYMNPAAEEMLEANPDLKEKIFGSGSLDDKLKNYSKEAVQKYISQSSASGDSPVEVFGSRVFVESQGKKFEVTLGNQIILLRDITDQYLIDAEIGKLYRHELKAALDIMGFGLSSARDLLSENKSLEATECLINLDKKRCELISLLEEKMDFIRIHSDSFQIKPSLLNLNLIVDRCISNYRETAASKKITINSNHLETDALEIMGEERFLIRALDNIVRNAVKFAETNGKLEVQIGRSMLEAYVSIKDDGCGISKENIKKIFQLGFTTGGSGRGLYLTKRIVAAHNGRITVDSKRNEGACFTVWLPCGIE